jgi:hypothetical protein
LVELKFYLGEPARQRSHLAPSRAPGSGFPVAADPPQGLAADEQAPMRTGTLRPRRGPRPLQPAQCGPARPGVSAPAHPKFRCELPPESRLDLFSLDDLADQAGLDPHLPPACAYGLRPTAP